MAKRLLCARLKAQKTNRNWQRMIWNMDEKLCTFKPAAKRRSLDAGVALARVLALTEAAAAGGVLEVAAGQELFTERVASRVPRR